MKFTCSVEINAPRDKVIALFQAAEYYPQWQDGFISITPISGDPGKADSKALILFKAGKREIQLTETIIENALPEYFSGLYEAKEMTNTNLSRFSVLSNGNTLYESDVEYTQFNGFMPKLMAKLMPGMFKKQVQKWMDQFKVFVEKQ